MRTWVLALALSLALGGTARSAAAQKAAGTTCATCEQDRAAARAELEEAVREARLAVAAYERAANELERENTSGTRARLTDAQRAVRTAMRRVEIVTARLAHAESQSARRVIVRSPSRPTPAAARGAHQGYMGVSLSTTASTRRGADGFVYYDFSRYPVIETVEPGSPAERAGLMAGDVLISLDDRDMTQKNFPLGKLLVPGKQLQVRVRRDGEVKEVRVRVDEVPGRRVVMAPADPVDVDIEPWVTVVPARPRTPAPPSAASPPTPALAPLPPMAPMIFELEHSETMALAGASLVQIKGDLRETFGVDRGVLVLQVGSGTPSSRAGLKAGDVIVTAAGRRIATPHDVQMALARSTERRAMDLVVVRKKERRELTLRW